jgi:hypothetical protein
MNSKQREQCERNGARRENGSPERPGRDLWAMSRKTEYDHGAQRDGCKVRQKQ